MKTPSNYWKKRIANNTWKAYNKAEIRNIKMVELYRSAQDDIYSEIVKFSVETNTSRTAAYNNARYLKLQEKLKAQIASVAKNIGNEIESDFTNQIIKMMSKQYESVSIAIGNESFTMLKENVFKQVLKEPWKGNNFSGRVWSNQSKLVDQLNKIILNGVASGRTVTEMAVRLDRIMGDGLKNAYRLIRSETMHFLNESALMAYKDKGVKQVEYLTAKDEDVCDQCGPLNEQVFDIGKEPILPLHPYCRCTYIPVIESIIVRNFEYSVE